MRSSGSNGPQPDDRHIWRGFRFGYSGEIFLGSGTFMPSASDKSQFRAPVPASDNAAQSLAQRKFPHRFRLPDALSVMRDGFLFVLQIGTQHFRRIAGGLDRLGQDARSSARDNQFVWQVSGHAAALRPRACTSNSRAMSVYSAPLQHLTVNRVGNDRSGYSRWPGPLI